jgi:hypothetical protein
MNTIVAVFIGALIAGGIAPSAVFAQKECPPEVAQAQAKLKSVQAAAKSKAVASGPQDVQAPRAQAGARTQEVNAPRTQEVNAPRTQEVNAPRSQGVQAPRTQEVNAPRTQDVTAPKKQGSDPSRVSKAETLVSQAQAACKKGDMAAASAKAKEALALLK